jgi:1-pyrroline-5-carboxylate dehydrogenase
MPIKPFRNEPPTDFSKPVIRKAMEKALAKVKTMLGKEYLLVIGGEEIHTEEKLKSLNPSRPSEIVGIFSKANLELANKAI